MVSSLQDTHKDGTSSGIGYCAGVREQAMRCCMGNWCEKTNSSPPPQSAPSHPLVSPRCPSCVYFSHRCWPSLKNIIIERSGITCDLWVLWPTPSILAPVVRVGPRVASLNTERRLISCGREDLSTGPARLVRAGLGRVSRGTSPLLPDTRLAPLVSVPFISCQNHEHNNFLKRHTL